MKNCRGTNLYLLRNKTWSDGWLAKEKHRVIGIWNTVDTEATCDPTMIWRTCGRHIPSYWSTFGRTAHCLLLLLRIIFMAVVKVTVPMSPWVVSWSHREALHFGLLNIFHLAIIINPYRPASLLFQSKMWTWLCDRKNETLRCRGIIWAICDLSPG